MPEPGPAGGGRPAATPSGFGRVLLALIVGQIGLHSAMAGLRMAAPLQVLREGFSPAAAGMLVALFAAAPVLLSLPAGRMADRHGYHRPVRLAVASTVLGALCAVAATWAAGWAQLGLLGLGSLLTGAGTNIGLIAIQRSAGRAASNSVERVRVFSWLGMAPSLSNVLGPVTAGLVIDLAGFRAAYVVLLLMPLLSLVPARHVPAQAPPTGAPRSGTAWGLLREPGFARLLAVNWAVSACWDVHTFAVPVLGHERGYAASTIGFILGIFTLAVTAVRLVIPLLAHRMREASVLRAAMLGTAAVFAVYPLAVAPWLMGALAVLLGLNLGAVQPMVMSTLHHLTPEHRHGEALALRSMAINLSSSLMPLAFGAAGAALGVVGLFWLMGGAVGAASWLARGLDAPADPAPLEADARRVG